MELQCHESRLTNTLVAKQILITEDLIISFSKIRLTLLAGHYKF